jgi:hypothetical protein
MPLHKIKIKGNGFSNSTSIEFDGIPLHLLKNAVLTMKDKEWITLDITLVGEIEVEQEGLIFFNTPDGRRFRVIEEVME